MYYIQIISENIDVQKRLCEYLNDRKIYMFDNDNNYHMYEIAVDRLTDNEIDELSDIFQMYEIEFIYN